MWVIIVHSFPSSQRVSLKYTWVNCILLRGSVEGKWTRAWKHTLDTHGSLKNVFGVCAQWATFFEMNVPPCWNTGSSSINTLLVVAVIQEYPAASLDLRRVFVDKSASSAYLISIRRCDHRAGTILIMMMITDTRFKCKGLIIRCYYPDNISMQIAC